MGTEEKCLPRQTILEVESQSESLGTGETITSCSHRPSARYLCLKGKDTHISLEQSKSAVSRKEENIREKFLFHSG